MLSGGTMFGQTGTDLAADGDGDGVVDQADYDLWMANFGKTGGGAGSTSGGALLLNGGTLKVPTITGKLVNSEAPWRRAPLLDLRTIGGNLFENAGVLQILISGIIPAASPGFDQLQIGGVAMLGGTLTVQLAGSFNPSIGQTFQFLTAAGGVSGTFRRDLRVVRVRARPGNSAMI